MGVDKEPRVTLTAFLFILKWWRTSHDKIGLCDSSELLNLSDSITFSVKNTGC